MSIAIAIDWYRKMLWTAILVGGPVILAGVVIGLIVAILQAATQVNDSAVAFAPKAVATIVTIVVAGPWMLAQLVDFTTAIFVAVGHLHP
ncbi:MAG: flagellar biosynthetic protein FliQ [Myxococcaceae bacterium]|nr:flagellar biosynthetic protein FliQ [Myxococcaceae bacterium]